MNHADEHESRKSAIEDAMCGYGQSNYELAPKRLIAYWYESDGANKAQVRKVIIGPIYHEDNPDEKRMALIYVHRRLLGQPFALRRAKFKEIDDCEVDNWRA